MRGIRLPEPPWSSGRGLARAHDMFEGGLHGAVRRAVIIGNGFPGAENQCFGLVRALGLYDRHSLCRVNRPTGGINKWLHCLPLSLHKTLDFLLRRFLFRNPLFLTSNRVTQFSSQKNGVLEADAKQIARKARETYDKDGPLLVIASGRDTIPVASSIKRLAPENVFVIQIQHPRVNLERFDLVITPRHDYYPLTPQAQNQIPFFLRSWITPREPPGHNVFLTTGALHQADSATLRNAASSWRNEFAALPKPLLVVNIGGPAGNCPYGEDLAKELIDMLKNVLWSCGSVRISFSRRSPTKVSDLLIREFSANPKVYIWNGKGQNPHLGHLAWADAFVITADSVSMLSEACSTGKPIYVIGAEKCTWKFADFQKSLQELGIVRPLTGKEDIRDSWSYPPLNDTAEAAKRVIAALAERGWRICL